MGDQLQEQYQQHHPDCIQSQDHQDGLCGLWCFLLYGKSSEREVQGGARP